MLGIRSGFRYDLHKHTGKGAWLSIKDGLENMYRKNPALQASWLESLGQQDISELFNLKAQNSDGTPTGLGLLIEHLTNVCNEVCYFQCVKYVRVFIYGYLELHVGDYCI